MILLYNISIYFLGIASRVASFFDPKAKAFVTGRKETFVKLRNELGNNQSPVIWVHCASLGEFEQGRPIIEKLKSDFPLHKILLTFFSPSGYEVRKDYAKADVVSYLPLDTAKNARTFLEITKPEAAIFVKYEFWHHYASTMKRMGIPAISSSSIFRNDQIYFSPIGGFARKILRNFSHFFVQNHESVALLKGIGIDEVTVAGDTRFDRVHQIVQHAGEIPIARAFKGDQRVFVVGSCWPEDLEVLVPFINENRLKFIIAPHEVYESNLAALEKALQVPAIRFSKASESAHLDNFSVLIIDNVGMLSRLYRYGEFAYVGGGFGKGLHNILEAACYGVPIMFGNKNYHKFQEAVDLINRGGAFEIGDYPDLKSKYEMLNVPATFLLACEVTRQYVEENLGATDKIMSYFRKLLNGAPNTVN
ncbi:MAG TPA: glycosyltransferase N-terminal domain-containing protein [Chryseosolibacter sp.]|nr:glycosyltransferase N-terminal domain-containing protein [Chryseosolibacter sp.]